MAIFPVLMVQSQPALIEEIMRESPHDHLKLSDTIWLISANKTVIDVSHSLGLSSFDVVAKNSAVIFATSAYYGRAAASVLDWIKVKLEGQPGD